MREYTLKRISGTLDWDSVAVMPIDTLLWTEQTDVSAQAQLCWDETAIYVRLKAVEQEIRREHTGLMDDVCEDSCLEFFLRPTEAYMYFNLEFNPNCALYLGYGTGMDDLVRLLVQDQQAVFQPQSKLTEDGWEITYRVPEAFIRQFFPDFAMAEGLSFYGNCYKCGDLTPNPHDRAWSPMNCESPAFHRPQDFGRLVLGGA